MDDITNFGTDSANINERWIMNIFENLKKAEDFERYAREGCKDIIEFVQIPFSQRNIVIGEIQYKNLKLMLNEMLLVLPDIKPVIEDTSELKTKLDNIANDIENKQRYIEYVSDVNGIKDSKMTSLFYKTLNLLSFMRESIIYQLRHILYIKQVEKKTW